MAKKLFIGMILLMGLLAGCMPVETETPVLPGATALPAAIPRLRIENGGAHDIFGLVVLFPDSRIVFGDIPAGRTSEYQPAPLGVYNYAAYMYQQDGETITQPVVDWVGESPRPGQSYIYVLDYDPQRENMLAIQLLEVRPETND